MKHVVRLISTLGFVSALVACGDGGGDAMMTGSGGAGGGGAGGSGVMPTYTSYPANDPNIVYTGRVNFATPTLPRFSQGGVHITARFDGTAVAMKMKDNGNPHNYYDAMVDGEVTQVIAPDPNSSDDIYPIATDLAPGEHVVTVLKRTEPTIGYGFFGGFEIDGTILSPPAAPAHKMLIIGDSITAGAGVEAANNSAGCTADGWGQPAENVGKAYGPVVAQALDADFQVVGVGGIGLTRNWSARYDGRPMPEVWDLLYPQEMTSPKWDTTLFTPDVIVIGLGTNDFSPGDPDDPTQPYPHPALDLTVFASTYIDFITALQATYPNAHVFMLSSPMLGDGWPAATDTFATDLKNALTMVEDHFVAAGNAKVHKFFVTKVTGRGCGTHPDAAQQAATAAELGPAIQSVMGW